jgi:hypothetical protein
MDSSHSLRGRMGAHALHARHDSKAISQPARDAFMARFVKEVDPDLVLDPEERARRAEHARKAYFTRLAYLSARARKGGRGT